MRRNSCEGELCQLQHSPEETKHHTLHPHMQANSYRIIYLYKQNEGAKQTEQNTVGFVTSETKFSAEHRNKPGVLIYMLHCGDCTSENKTSYQRRGQR